MDQEIDNQANSFCGLSDTSIFSSDTNSTKMHISDVNKNSSICTILPCSIKDDILKSLEAGNNYQATPFDDPRQQSIAFFENEFAQPCSGIK
jgi:hypothetical protein